MKHNQQIQIIGAESREIELLGKNRKVILQELFTPKTIDDIISQIQNQILDFSADSTTKQGREAIKSMAAKVARCKAPIKALATELKEESRKLIDGVNKEWNRYEFAIDELRDKIRKPVDEIEEKEAAELKERQDRLNEIINLKNISAYSCVDLQEGISKANKLFDYEWQDFAFKAETVKNEVIGFLQEKLIFARKYKAEQDELIKLRREALEREAKEREEQIVRQATEKAETEYKRRIERIEHERIAAENRAKEAEKLAKEQAEKAEQNRIAAEQKARDEALRAAEAAVEAEWRRIEAEAEKQRLETEKREANKRHRTKINNEIMQALEIVISNADGAAYPDELPRKIIEAISKGEVPHIQINY